MDQFLQRFWEKFSEILRWTFVIQINILILSLITFSTDARSSVFQCEMSKWAFVIYSVIYSYKYPSFQIFELLYNKIKMKYDKILLEFISETTLYHWTRRYYTCDLTSLSPPTSLLLKEEMDMTSWYLKSLICFYCIIFNNLQWNINKYSWLNQLWQFIKDMKWMKKNQFFQGN